MWVMMMFLFTRTWSERSRSRIWRSPRTMLHSHHSTEEQTQPRPLAGPSPTALPSYHPVVRMGAKGGALQLTQVKHPWTKLLQVRATNSLYVLGNLKARFPEIWMDDPKRILMLIIYRSFFWIKDFAWDCKGFARIDYFQTTKENLKTKKW